MKTIELYSSAWHGDELLSLEFPEWWDVAVLGDQDLPALSEEAIRREIQMPIGCRPLSELALKHKRAAILVDDLTRPTPAAIIIPILLEEMYKRGMKNEQIIIVIAGGTHPPASREDIRKKLGDQIPQGIATIVHDDHQALSYLGKSKRGTPIFINQAVTECDLKIGVGCIFPHPAAGFSGGTKILVPGLTGYKTTQYLHDHLLGAKQRGGSIQSEFKQETDDIADLIGLDFIVNVTLNQRRQIAGVFAGDKIEAFRSGVDHVRKAYTIDTHADADITIADMYPFDANLQFAHDRGLWPLELARKGSSKIILASCPKGAGGHALFPIKNPLWPRLYRRLRHFQLRDIKTLVYRIKAAKRLFSRKSLDPILVSPNLPDEEFKLIFPAGKVYPDWPSTRSWLEKQHPHHQVKVALYRCAPMMIPK